MPYQVTLTMRRLTDSEVGCVINNEIILKTRYQVEVQDEFSRNYQIMQLNQLPNFTMCNAPWINYI